MLQNDLPQPVEGQSCEVEADLGYFAEEVGVLVEASEVDLLSEDVVGGQVGQAGVDGPAEGGLEG